MNLPALKKVVTQQNINLYAEASQDFNPIHIDEDFAKKTALGGTIAHGMLILAYASQMMSDTFGRNWLTNGKLNIRFKKPARPGDNPDAGLRIAGCAIRHADCRFLTSHFSLLICSRRDLTSAARSLSCWRISGRR